MGLIGVIHSPDRQSNKTPSSFYDFLSPGGDETWKPLDFPRLYWKWLLGETPVQFPDRYQQQFNTRA